MLIPSAFLLYTPFSRSPIHVYPDGSIYTEGSLKIAIQSIMHSEDEQVAVKMLSGKKVHFSDHIWWIEQDGDTYRMKREVIMLREAT